MKVALSLVSGVTAGAALTYLWYWYWKGGEGLVLEPRDVAVIVTLLIGCFLFGFTG